MTRTLDNGNSMSSQADQVLEQISTGAAADASGNVPFVPKKDKPKPSLKDNGRLLFIGSGIVLVLLLLTFNGLSRQPLPKQKHAGYERQNPMPDQDKSASSSVMPILEAREPAEQDRDVTLVDADQIRRLAMKDKTDDVPQTLGDIRPFGKTQDWQPEPYAPTSELVPTFEPVVDSTENRQTNDGRDKADKPSLVFIRSNVSDTKAEEKISQIHVGIGLAPGTRLRAKLESAVSTAVRTPVVAVIEYNYEVNGAIVIPAGAKAFGHVESADRSGYVGMRFDLLLMPDGSSVVIQAAATDTQLRPLKGKVQGSNGSKNILVRSFAGVGEIAATLVGRGSLNQPFNEQDLLRERITSNIGQASDQAIASLLVRENISVSLPAGTEIYVILQKPANESNNADSAARAIPGAGHMDELRQLMQLQRELN